MRFLLLAILVSWACAEGAEPPRQFDTAPNATADATGEEAATLVQAPDEQEEQEEWTAVPPKLGKPKVSGPPYPHLNEDSKRGLFDALRKLRWLVWEYEQAVRVETSYLQKWEGWAANWATSVSSTPGARSNIMWTLCGHWGGDMAKVANQGNAWGRGSEGLIELITQYARLYPTVDVRATVSMWKEGLMRPDVGETASSWLAKLETVVEEIARIERGNRVVAARAESNVLEIIDNCTADMTLNLCPHPAMSWNINDGHCSNPP